MTLLPTQQHRLVSSFRPREHCSQTPYHASVITRSHCQYPRLGSGLSSACPPSLSQPVAFVPARPQQCMHRLARLQQASYCPGALSSMHQLQAGTACFGHRCMGRSGRVVLAQMQTSSAAGISSTSTATLTQAALQQADLSQLEGKLKIIGEALNMDQNKLD